MKKLSLIVPIYNSEKYLEELLNSVVSQDEDVEILLVNDGSTDNSLSICEKYLYKDDRIKIYNKNNQGVSQARNFAIEKCNGEYIYFADSDDILKPDAISTIINNCVEADLICFGYQKKYRNKTVDCVADFVVTNDNILDFIFKDSNVGGYLWNKVFKRNIIIKHNIRFDENIFFGEVLLFVVRYIKYANSINYIPKVLYCYRMRAGSLSNGFPNEKSLSILNVYLKLIRENFEEGLINNLKQFYLISFYKYKGFYNYLLMDDSIKKEEKRIISEMNLVTKLKLTLVKNFPKLYAFIKTIQDKDLFG